MTPTEPARTPALVVRDATKSFRTGDDDVRVLDGVTLELAAGEVAVVRGPSGSGKSTLLHAISGLDPLDAGTVTVAGTDVGTLGPAEAARFRRSELGFVFQFFQLIPTLTAVENVAMPLVLDGVAGREADARAADALEAVGLAGLGGRYASELSGGQLQRVAVARALVGEPVLVLADEPTGSLDRASGAEVSDLLHAAAAERGAALVIVTHDPAVARPGDRNFELVDGRLRED